MQMERLLPKNLIQVEKLQELILPQFFLEYFGETNTILQIQQDIMKII